MTQFFDLFIKSKQKQILTQPCKIEGKLKDLHTTLQTFTCLLALVITMGISSSVLAQTPPSDTPSIDPSPSPTPILSPSPSPSPLAVIKPAAAPSLSSPSSEEAIQFDHLDSDGTLTYKTKNKIETLKTSFYDSKYLGTLRPKEGGLPYFLLIAKPCNNCPDDQAVYLMRPRGEKPTALVYPGKILDPKTRTILLDSRAFYGKCINNRGDVYVVFQKERVDRRHQLQSSVMIAEPARDHLRETLLERHLPNIKNTLQLIKKKSCFEIDGRNRLMLRKPLDLHPRDNGDKDDDEDEDEKKDDSKELSP